MEKYLYECLQVKQLVIYMYGKLITVKVTPEMEKRKHAKLTTWAHLIERGLQSLEEERDYGIEIQLLSNKIERLTVRLDEQVKKNWVLEEALSHIKTG